METAACRTRPLWQPLVLLATILALLMAGWADSASAGKTPQVDRYNVNKDTLTIKKKGKTKKLDVASDVVVRLEKRSGKTTRANENELVPGADIEDIEADAGEVEEIDLEEQPSGSSDCSFDMSEEDEGVDESFDCSEDYEDESQDCSFDQSGSKSPGDMDKDTSWDCSYEDDAIRWDCSYDSSQSASWDPDGGDADGDF